MKNNSWLKIFLTASCLLFIFCSAAAAGNLSDAFKTKDKSAEDALDKAAQIAGYNIKAGASDITKIIAVIIQSVLGLLGVIFLILIIYGGIIWMTAGGEEQKVELAQKIIKNATIGLIITVAAYAISYFVIYSLSSNVLTTTG